MNGPEFEVPQWSEYQEARINEEADECERHNERVREMNSPGCTPECRKRYHDSFTLEQKIEIQKQNIAAARLLCRGATVVEHFQAKLIALMEEQNVDQRAAGEAETRRCGAGVSGDLSD